MNPDPLAAWAVTPGGRNLLAEARRRIERGNQLVRGTLHLELTSSERHDIGELLGVEWEVSGREVPLRALHDALEVRHTTLRAVLEASAPLRNHAAERAAIRTAAEAEKTRCVEILVAAGVRSDVGNWALSRRGVPRAGAGALVALVDAAVLVLSKLPGEEEPPILLTELAGNLFDSTHALDRTKQLGRTLARIIAAREVESESLASIEATSPSAWRAVWASAGVICDEVSSLVLVLNVPLEGSAPAAQMTGIEGDPVWLSLRSLRGTWRPAITRVWVCENPSIVEAAADRLGKACPPLVCTFGQPTIAALELLRGFVAAGVVIRIRADDDAAGQSIVAKLRTVVPDAELWRYEIRSPQEASESPVYEEQLMNLLLQDLESANR